MSKTCETCRRNFTAARDTLIHLTAAMHDLTEALEPFGSERAVYDSILAAQFAIEGIEPPVEHKEHGDD